MPRASVFALAALALLAAAARADDWDRSFPVTGRAGVVIRTGDGHVRVTEGRPGVVAVHVHTATWRIGRQVHVDARQVNGRVEIEAREPSWDWGLSFSFHGRAALEIEVTAPHQSDLEIRTGDGAVEVERISGRIEIESGDGRVRTESVSGDVRLHTGDGAIDARDLDGRFSAVTGDGPVRVGGRFDALEVATGDGRVVVEAGEGSRVGPGWTLESGDGPLTLRLAGSLAADLDLRTRDGRISLGIPLQTDVIGGRRHLHGSLNGGGALIRVRTGDGSIRLERL